MCTAWHGARFRQLHDGGRLALTCMVRPHLIHIHHPCAHYPRSTALPKCPAMTNPDATKYTNCTGAPVGSTCTMSCAAGYTGNAQTFTCDSSSINWVSTDAPLTCSGKPVWLSPVLPCLSFLVVMRRVHVTRVCRLSDLLSARVSCTTLMHDPHHSVSLPNIRPRDLYSRAQPFPSARLWPTRTPRCTRATAPRRSRAPPAPYLVPLATQATW